MLDRTQTFSIGSDNDTEMKKVLTIVYDALREKGIRVESLAIVDSMSDDSLTFRSM